VNASDADAGDNARLRFELVPSSTTNEFTIDRNTGLISATTSLDRERQSHYRFQVRLVNIDIEADGAKNLCFKKNRLFVCFLTYFFR
jgi:hypothetical protein